MNLCAHTYPNGHLCESPALRNERLCYYHKRDHDRRARLDQNLDHRRSLIASGNTYELNQVLRDGKTVFDDNCAELFQDLQAPSLDNGNAIQTQLSTVFYAIATQQVSPRAAALMLYNLQIASANLKNTRPPDHDRARKAEEDSRPIPAFEPFLEAMERARQKAVDMAASLGKKKVANGAEG